MEIEMSCRVLIKTVLVVLVSLCAFGIPGCATNEAQPAMLTGQDEQPQQRHATGIESHARDM